eukprot:2455171-Prymnesium_polylepis.1
MALLSLYLAPPAPFFYEPEALGLALRTTLLAVTVAGHQRETGGRAASVGKCFWIYVPIGVASCSARAQCPFQQARLQSIP